MLKGSQRTERTPKIAYIVPSNEAEFLENLKIAVKRVDEVHIFTVKRERS